MWRRIRRVSAFPRADRRLPTALSSPARWFSSATSTRTSRTACALTFDFRDSRRRSFVLSPPRLALALTRIDRQLLRRRSNVPLTVACRLDRETLSYARAGIETHEPPTTLRVSKTSLRSFNSAEVCDAVDAPVVGDFSPVDRRVRRLGFSDRDDRQLLDAHHHQRDDRRRRVVQPGG